MSHVLLNSQNCRQTLLFMQLTLRALVSSFLRDEKFNCLSSQKKNCFYCTPKKQIQLPTTPEEKRKSIQSCSKLIKFVIFFISGKLWRTRGGILALFITERWQILQQFSTGVCSSLVTVTFHTKLSKKTLHFLVLDLFYVCLLVFCKKIVSQSR